MASLTINDFQGGIADNPESTIANKFAMGQGLDISQPHILTVNQKLKQVGSTELLRAMTVGQRSYGFSSASSLYTGISSSNGIYELNETALTWGLKHTYTGNAPILNAESFGEYLITAAETHLHKGYLPLSGTETYNSTAGTFSGTVSSQNHPMYNDGATIYIGNGNKLSKYNLTTGFDNDIVPLGDNVCITDVIGDGQYITLLCKSIHGGSSDIVVWWDGFSEHYNYKIDLPFSAEAFGKIDNALVVFGEQNGTIYQVTQTGYSKVSNKTLLREGNTPAQYTPVKATVYSFSNYGNLDSGLCSPTANTGLGFVDFSNPTNAYSSNNTYSTGATGATIHCWYDFDVPTIPIDSTILGIAVSIEAKIGTAGESYPLMVSLTKDKSTTAGSGKQSSSLTTSDTTITIGGATELWNTTWSPSDFGTNFGVIIQNASAYTVSIDHIQVKVYYYGYTPTAIALGVRSINAFSAVNNFKNKLLFAPQYGNILYGGIWSIGKNNDNLAVNYDWRIGDGTKAVYSINNRYLLPNEPPNFYVCVVGDFVYEIDYSNKVTDAYYESLILDCGSPTTTKRFDYVVLNTKPLPVSTSILVKKKVNGESSWVTVGTYSGTGKAKQQFPIPNSNVGENIQLQFTFTVSGNNAPSIKSYELIYTPIASR